MRDARPEGLIGTVIDGRYYVESVAGEGGFGVVYRAQHLAFDVPVAIKMLKLSEGYDPATREKRIADFRREGRLLFKLSSMHPSFVQAKEAGTYLTAQGAVIPYLVLEWLNGVPLSHELRRRRALGARPFAIDEAVQLLDFAVAGLSVAHQNGIAHADLKPGNLFVTARDDKLSVRILDFGLARVVANVLGTPRNSSDSVSPKSFTPAYAAPEQWLARLGKSGTWTDVHALALVCVELLLGSPPLRGSDPAQLMGACLDPIRPTPRRLGVAVTPLVEAVFARALSLSPHDRHPDLLAFWRDLRRVSGEPSEGLSAARLVSTFKDPLVPDAHWIPVSATLPTAGNDSDRTAVAIGMERRPRPLWRALLTALVISFGGASLLPVRALDRAPVPALSPARAREPTPRASVLAELTPSSAAPANAEPSAAQPPEKRVRRARSSAENERTVATASPAVELRAATPALSPEPTASRAPRLEDLLRRDEFSTRY